MKTLIIGASGLVGSNCLKHFKQQNWDTIGTYFSYQAENTVFYDTLNPTNEENFNINEFQPEAMIHCGALTFVDYCETNEEESFQKTVQSTIHLVEKAKEVNAKFIYISTDYVFDGEAGPYKEDATPNPLSVYGRHKLEAENIVKNSGLDYIILRVAKVFGHEERQKNFVARMCATIEEKGELTWNGFTDQHTTAINAMDIAKVAHLLLRDGKSGIYHLGYGEYFNAYEMVLKIGNQYPDATKNVKPITKADFKQDADRPPLGGLSNEKILSEYPDFQFSTIEDYIAERKALSK